MTVHGLMRILHMRVSISLCLAIPTHHKIDGGLSVLFYAVLLLVSTKGAELLTKKACARDFVADAFAHMKLMGYTTEAVPLLQKAGLLLIDFDTACVTLSKPADTSKFLKACKALRFWGREAVANAVQQLRN